MKRMKSNYSALELLKNAKPKLRKAIISNCDPNLLKCISECALNVLHGNVNLSGCSIRKLRKHKSQLRKVADKRVSHAKKKKLIGQRGGFLLPLLSAVLPALASLVFRPQNAST
jgi:hypothetical protein